MYELQFSLDNIKYREELDPPITLEKLKEIFRYYDNFVVDFKKDIATSFYINGNYIGRVTRVNRVNKEDLYKETLLFGYPGGIFNTYGELKYSSLEDKINYIQGKHINTWKPIE